MDFIVAEKQGTFGLLLVITDKELMGKYFEEGKLQLDLTKKFYCGNEKSKEDIIDLIEKTKTFHFTGKKSVDLGIEQKLVSKNKVLIVDNIPHAEVVIASD
jgi:hypothetical protein